MVWTVLQTIGSLLSGVSIFTAFILYRIEKNDVYIKDVRQAIADMRATIGEQYSLLESSYIYSYAEEFFSNRYVQHYLSDLGAYIENHLDKSADEIKKYCHNSNLFSPLLDSPILFQNNTQNQYHANNAKITRSITYDLADIKDLAHMIELFQQESRNLECTISEGITNEDFGIDAICDVLVENRVYINNESIMRRKLIQKYIQRAKANHETQLAQLRSMHGVIDIFLKQLFSLSDKELASHISSRRKYAIAHHDCISDELMQIINALPDKLFSDCKTECSRKIGNMDSLHPSKKA